MQFSLDGQPFIELNKLLKINSLVASGGEANMVITEQMVKVNGTVETAKRKKMHVGDQVEFAGELIEVVE